MKPVGVKVNTPGRERAAKSQKLVLEELNHRRRIVLVEVPGRKGPTLFEAYEHNRPGMTREALANRHNRTITAGNAPGLNTGAAAIVLAEESWAEKRGLAPVGRLSPTASRPLSRAAALPMATQSVRRGPCSQPASFTRCAVTV